jgi:hypothetical protein
VTFAGGVYFGAIFEILGYKLVDFEGDFVLFEKAYWGLIFGDDLL